MEPDIGVNEVRVVHWQASNDGKLNAATLRRKLENAGYTVSTYTYPPGTSFPIHTHGVDKCDAVLSGRFKISCGEHAVVLEAGDMMFVPAGLEHAAEVLGDEPVISLDGIAAGT